MPTSTAPSAGITERTTSAGAAPATTTAASDVSLGMQRILIGGVFLGHGLLHSALGIWSAGFDQPWVSTPLWLAAQLGFMVAGFGVLGVPWFRRAWMPGALLGALSSLLMFALYAHTVLKVGIVVDLAVLLFGVRWREPSVAEGAAAGHSLRRRIANVAAMALVAWTGVVIAARPWYMTWGASPEAREARLPGDELTPAATYRSDRAVVIRASVAAVWPWLAQIGQDRGGFYSYDLLERMIGDRVYNADRIHPEWQVVQAGQLVRGAQPDYLGGRLGRDIGWRVAEVVPGRAIVLDGWGAFVLQPVDAVTTLLQVRTRAEWTPTVASTLLSPLRLLALEPAHFIMERRMLLGIRDRAEQS